LDSNIIPWFLGNLCFNIIITSYVLMIITYAAKQELVELLEDSIEYFCDQERVSGQTAWTAVSALATAKLMQLNNEIK
tara:strand:+ start:2482 stop:2715 length:234 start_codon:yes stop_codon:yes gene_type:complete